MAYIDSKLAERFNHTAETSSKDDKNYDDRQRTDSTASSAPIRREPTNMGRLQEIELPAAPDAQIPPRKNEIQAAKPPRKRVGRNGKEYTSKPRKRRASEDLRRDALVEAVLHENSNSIYELPPPPPTVTSGVAGWNEDADEALAEQFRREFMADVGERRTTKMVKGMDDDGLKGPKLGGSRSQRVVVRELLLRGQEGKR